ncbi:CLUMA_CG018077, isoform A [Clunio marinus]|uniref:CLUMA_CG018077, isoform A n=1 Tax=Clunio marinus TaxID=568069 RepID=A0A1J1IXW0_9DIPT|nr:CLUMA_CG018077, isoform A [Clunio marinus]
MSDTAMFTCEAINYIGRSKSYINMTIQGIPVEPDGINIIDKSGRSVKIAWNKPFDRNSPFTRYIIEYKRRKGSWDWNVDQVMVPGDSTNAEIKDLIPITDYNFRIFAENEIGRSKSSNIITLLTSEDKLSGKPHSIVIDTISQTSLKVRWKAPAREDWNSKYILYNVVYKETSSDKNFEFYVKDHIPHSNANTEQTFLIENLKTFTQYSVVVQAFNIIGEGPLSNVETKYTAERTPEQPPRYNTNCKVISSQTIEVFWNSTFLRPANGVIIGYKLLYAPSNIWDDDEKKNLKKVFKPSITIHGLKKFTNFTFQVFAYNSEGDDISSDPINCQTDEDLPEVPSAIKAIGMSYSSLLVAWKPPKQTNGIITQYKVYMKSNVANKAEVQFEVEETDGTACYKSGLKNNIYEVCVSAWTRIGEGDLSECITLNLNEPFPPRIPIFDQTIKATLTKNVDLPYYTIGPTISNISWQFNEELKLQFNDRISQFPVGSLKIRQVIRQDAGEYKCIAENLMGTDSVTYKLIVLAPPLPSHVTTTESTNQSVLLTSSNKTDYIENDVKKSEMVQEVENQALSSQSVDKRIRNAMDQIAVSSRNLAQLLKQKNLQDPIHNEVTLHFVDCLKNVLDKKQTQMNERSDSNDQSGIAENSIK